MDGNRYNQYRYRLLGILEGNSDSNGKNALLSIRLKPIKMARQFSVKIGKKLQILILIFDLIPDLNKKTVLVIVSIFEYN